MDRCGNDEEMTPQGKAEETSKQGAGEIPVINSQIDDVPLEGVIVVPTASKSS